MKTKLECIYLMNIALYLPLTDIPTFSLINSKCKDALDGLKINPITSGNERLLKQELHIIQHYFPRLETVYFKKETIIQLIDSYETYQECIPHVKLMRCNSQVDIIPNTISSSTDNSQFVNKIIKRIDRIQYHPSLNLNECYNLRHLVISDRLFLQHIDDLLNLKDYIHLELVTVEFLYGVYAFLEKEIENIITFCSKVNKVIFFIDFNSPIEYHFRNNNAKHSVLPSLKHCQVFQSIGNSLLFSLAYSDTISYIVTSEELSKLCHLFQSNKNERIIEKEMYSTIDKLYCPSFFSLDSKEKTRQMNNSCCPTKYISLPKEGTFTLPSSTYIIESLTEDQCIITNWEDLKTIKHIYSWNYNINTPKELYHIEKNKYPHNELEITITSLLYFCFIPLLIMLLFYSFLSIRFGNSQKIYTTILPGMILFLLNRTVFVYYLESFQRKHKKSLSSQSYILMTILFSFLFIIPLFFKRYEVHLFSFISFLFLETYQWEKIESLNGFTRIKRLLNGISPEFVKEEYNINDKKFD